MLHLKKSQPIQSVENALIVLEAFCDINGEACLADLSKSLGMSKSFVWRLLKTFTQRGYLERDESSGKYRLGLTAQLMGVKFRARMGLLNKARPVMRHLARECNEAVYIAVPYENNFLLLDMIDTAHAVRTRSLVGNSYSLDETAIGKVIRAFNVAQNAKREEAVSSSVAERQSQLQEGACYDYGGFGEGTACVAFPLYTVQRKLSGVLSFIGPEFRFPPERINEELFPLLKESSRVVSSITERPYC